MKTKQMVSRVCQPFRSCALSGGQEVDLQKAWDVRGRDVRDRDVAEPWTPSMYWRNTEWCEWSPHPTCVRPSLRLSISHNCLLNTSRHWASSPPQAVQDSWLGTSWMRCATSIESLETLCFVYRIIFHCSKLKLLVINHPGTFSPLCWRYWDMPVKPTARFILTIQPSVMSSDLGKVQTPDGFTPWTFPSPNALSHAAKYRHDILQICPYI